VIAARDDVFGATREEIADFYRSALPAGVLAQRIVSRIAEWRADQERDRVQGAEAYPAFLLGDTPVFETAIVSGSQDDWRGRGVSPGIGRGAARIVREPRELGRVEPGDILVAPSTDPAWTPVFARLAALVTERGGVLSHSAVVAREYRLPAVTAIENITYALTDGEQIEVDGTTGRVRRIESLEKSSGLLRPAAQ
jgi:pyruvate,water dikinase